MNYYEQFYDDLETMDYDEANARNDHNERRRHSDYPYYAGDYNHGPFLDDCDPYYEQSHRGHLDSGGRGPDQFYGSRGQGEFEGLRGQGHFKGSRGQRGNYFERGRGWSRAANNYGDKGGQWRGRGGAERGRGAPNRGRRVPRDGKRGKFEMNFVKAGTAFVEENQEGNTDGNTHQRSASNEPSDIEKNVEQGLKEFRCQLGYGYGYGARSDLVDGTPGAAWIAMGEAPIGSMQTEPIEPMSEDFNNPSEMPKPPSGSNEENTVDMDMTSASADTSVIEKLKIAAPVRTGVARPAWNFVKAQSEFRSTDVAFHETASVTKPVPNTVSVNMGNKRVGLGFGVSAKAIAGAASVVREKFHGGLKDGTNKTFDAKFARLHEAVKLKNLPNKNGIEVMHMAIDRVKMAMVDDTRPGGRTSTGQPMFLCRLEVDGVLVSEGLSTTKKGAKHDAFKNAVELLLKEGLTVKEAPGGGLELKALEPEPEAGTFLAPPATVLQSAPLGVNKGVAKAGQGQSVAKTQLPVKPIQSGNVKGQKPYGQSEETFGKSATAYGNPKIVFHNQQSDKPLEFKMPGKTGPSHSGQSAQAAEMMAQNLLNFVKNESAEFNQLTKDTIEVTIEIESARKMDVLCMTGSESKSNEESQTNIASSLSSVTKTAVNNESRADVTSVSLGSSPTNVPDNKPEAIIASTIVDSGSSSMVNQDVTGKSKTDTPSKNVNSSSSLNATSTSLHSASSCPGSATPTALSTIPQPLYIPRQMFVKSSDSQKQDFSTTCMTESVKNKPLTTKGFTDLKSQNVPTKFIKQSFVKLSHSLDQEKSEHSSSEIYHSAPPQSLGTYRPPSKSGRLQSTVHAVNQSPQNNPRKRTNDTPLTPVYSKLKSRKVNKMNDLDDLSQFIIIDSTEVSGCQIMTDLSILHTSANMNKVVMKVEYEPTGNGFNCSFVISDHLIGTMFGVNKEDAKVNAAKATLDELREMCYTIKVLQNVDSDEGGLTKDQLMSDVQKANERLPDSNVGNMLLRKMGWTGGGVGKDGQGRAEPVKAEMVIGREGLGLKASRGVGKEFNKIVTKMLEDYVKSDEQKDLHFSSELSKEERAIIHNIGQKMGLKTQSKGKDSERYLIISRKRTARELLEHVMRNGGSTSKYLVVPPSSGTNEFWSNEDVAFGHGKQ